MKDEPISACLMFVMGTFLMLFVPLMWSVQMADKLTQVIVDNKVHEFVNTSCATGYISYSNLDKFMGYISVSGNRYDIKLEHKSRKSYPTEDGGYQDMYESHFNEYIYEYLIPDDGSHPNYQMKNGDYFIVSVSLSTPTSGANILNLLTPLRVSDTVHVNYGWRVSNSEG